MKYKVDGFELDKENVEFNNAAEFVRHTDSLIYLTGKAGTGKTTFLKYIRNTTNKNVVIVAPTGVASINAGGVTINSFFQIPFGPFVPNDSRLRLNAGVGDNRETIYSTFTYREEKKEIINNMELLIIDEVSMVRADTLDVIDRILRVFRGEFYRSFGGVQVILIGDTFQLPPIAKSDEWGILSPFYKTPFFFSSKVIESHPPIYIELKKIYRQNEREFIELLNRVRVNKVTQNDFDVLNSKYDPVFSGNGSDYIILATHNRIVNEINLTKLNQIDAEIFTFEANVTGDFPDRHKPTDHFMKLKVGAQVMFIKNDTGEFKRYYNGKIGKIEKLDEGFITVVFDDESQVEVERSVWNNIKYAYNQKEKRVEKEVIGTFEQFPIRLAWAITVHKSQGLTFEKVIADLGRAFAPGQVYVALSRCTSFNGLRLRTKINNFAVKTDPKVLEFAQNETPDTLIAEQLNTGRADFYYKKSRKHFFKGDFALAFMNFKKALKFRNDIETENFERFITVQSTRLFSYKVKYESAISSIRMCQNDLQEYRQLIKDQAGEITKKNDQIQQQNSSVELLLSKTREFENKSNILEKKVVEIDGKLNISVKSTKQLESELEKTKLELRKQVEQNRLLELEVNRLENMTWYQKLFGK